MTRLHHQAAASAINVAKVVLTGALIGGSAIALPVQASAASGQWRQGAPQTWAMDLPLAPAPGDPVLPPVPPGPDPAAAAGGLLPGPDPVYGGVSAPVSGRPGAPASGPPPVPPVQTDPTSQSPGQLGFFTDMWNQYHNLDPNEVTAGDDGGQPVDPAASPPPGSALDTHGPQGPPPPP